MEYFNFVDVSLCVNKIRFCLILKVSHALVCLVYYYLDCTVIYIVSSQKFSLAWNSHYFLVFIFRYCNGQFPSFGEYVISQLHPCTALAAADCTENSCSSNISLIFDKFLVFNFPFFQFRAIISSFWIIISLL